MSSAADIVWAPLAKMLADGIVAATPSPRCVAIAGAQGSGKSTLAKALAAALASAGVRAIACSLDDFYYPRAERAELARTVHPLLVTRGVPGTHDVELCEWTLAGLHERATPLPAFDKGLDERVEAREWRRAGPVDVVILEGWCLGARPQRAADLAAPVNALERDEDPDGVWRRFVDAELNGRYRRLFARFDRLTFLAVPGMEAVRRWRAQQELQIAPARRMSEAQLERFVAHYERLTRWMLADVPGRADLTVELDNAHRIARTLEGRNDAIGNRD